MFDLLNMPFGNAYAEILSKLFKNVEDQYNKALTGKNGYIIEYYYVCNLGEGITVDVSKNTEYKKGLSSVTVSLNYQEPDKTTYRIFNYGNGPYIQIQYVCQEETETTYEWFDDLETMKNKHLRIMEHMMRYAYNYMNTICQQN